MPEPEELRRSTVSLESLMPDSQQTPGCESEHLRSLLLWVNSFVSLPDNFKHCLSMGFSNTSKPLLQAWSNLNNSVPPFFSSGGHSLCDSPLRVSFVYIF